MPKVQRPRPTDATGLFWSLVVLLPALFFFQVWPVVGLLFLMASPACFIWQFVKWRSDFVRGRQAVAWCHRHYASYGGSPVVDFIIALAHDTGCDVTQLAPSTPLDELNWIAEDDDEFIFRSSEFSSRHQVWLEHIVFDARISGVDLSAFSGMTLHDAVHFVAMANRRAVVTGG